MCKCTHKPNGGVGGYGSGCGGCGGDAALLFDALPLPGRSPVGVEVGPVEAVLVARPARAPERRPLALVRRARGTAEQIEHKVGTSLYDEISNEVQMQYKFILVKYSPMKF